MRLGLSTGYWGSGPPSGVVEGIETADRLGFEHVWTAEAYGSDALTPLAWWGANTQNVKLGTSIMQMSARTPAATAMAAMTMDHLSRGRFIAGIGASLEKFATEIRALQRTEIREAEEPFTEGLQTGSSSMPHKRNPELCERVCGLARTLRGYSIVGLENVALWHERDISHSGADRIAFPDSTGLLAYMLKIFTGVMDGLRVYPERMQANLEQTRGLVFSAKVLNALLAAGLQREVAYKIVQANAMKAWHDDLDYRSLLEADPEVTSRLSMQQLDELFDVNAYLVHIDDSFRRLGLLEANP